MMPLWDITWEGRLPWPDRAPLTSTWPASPTDRPIPLDLVTQIVKVRVAENSAHAARAHRCVTRPAVARRGR